VDAFSDDYLKIDAGIRARVERPPGLKM